METTEINQTEDLIKCINDLPNSYIFRGQPDSSWNLQTTLERACGNKFNRDFANKCEKYSIDEFSARFHFYMKHSKVIWIQIYIDSKPMSWCLLTN